MTETIGVLQQYGGWATTFFLAMWHLKIYQDKKKLIAEKDKQIVEMNKAHHQEVVAVVRECTGVLATVHESLRRCAQHQDGRRSPGGRDHN